MLKCRACRSCSFSITESEQAGCQKINAYFSKSCIWLLENESSNSPYIAPFLKSLQSICWLNSFKDLFRRGLSKVFLLRNILIALSTMHRSSLIQSLIFCIKKVLYFQWTFFCVFLLLLI